MDLKECQTFKNNICKKHLRVTSSAYICIVKY